MKTAAQHLIDHLAARGCIPVTDTTTQEGTAPTWDIDDLISPVDPEELCRRQARTLRRKWEQRLWWNRLADRISFALMDVASFLDFPIWMFSYREFRLGAHGWSGGVAFSEVLLNAPPWARFIDGDRWYVLAHDGWKPGRYV